jgi:hypothetical protein
MPSPERSYWLDLFTSTTWTEFINSGGEVSGFRARRRKVVEQMQIGDYLLCYLTGISRFIGVLEVTSKSYVDETPIWKTEAFPARVRVKILAQVGPQTAVPIVDLLPSFSWYSKLKAPHAWTGHFRGSPTKMSRADGEMVTAAILKAVEHPTVTEFDPRKLKRPAYRPKTLPTATVYPLRAAVGHASSTATLRVHEPDVVPVEADQEPEEVAKTAPAHREMQFTLAKLGNDLGLSVWLPPSDRGQEYEGQKFTDLQLGEIPLMFSAKALRTVRNIDVIWLGDGSIEACFEIESTTSIYSGILRMADLIAMVPGIAIPLYVVAPDARRRKVYEEVTRPTFSRLSPAMAKICRYIPFSALRLQLPIGTMRSYLSPQFIRTLSEECVREPE